MIIQYIDEYDEELLEQESMMVPRLKDRICIDNDYYFVTDIVWNLNQKKIIISLSENIKSDKPKESKVHDNGALSEAKQAAKLAEKALKETKDIKDEFISLRQFIKSQKGKK